MTEKTLEEIVRDQYALYWAFNVPLQAYKDDDGSFEILNYAPRKNSVLSIPLTDVVDDPTHYPAFFNRAADILENLARQFRELAEGKVDMVYYPDEGMEDSE